MSELWRRLCTWVRGSRFDQDLADEMRLHLELRAAEKEADGMAPDAAQAAAKRRFGNLTRIHEESREAWGWRWLDTSRQDIRYALRTLVANPAFTATAVLSLMLGIGANTAIFSIVNAVMLRTLPVEDPQKLVQVTIGGNTDLTNPIWEHVRDHQQVFSGVLAYANERFDLASGGESRFAAGMWVSGDFFRVLGVPPARGRVFTMEDDRHGGGTSGPVAVISYNFWKRNFQGDDGVIGRTLRLNRHEFEIVGVTPPWFTGLDRDRSYDVAVPLGCEPVINTGSRRLEERLDWWLWVLGRVAGGTMEQAEDRMKALAPEVFRATVPSDFSTARQDSYRKNSFSLQPAATGFSATRSQYRSALFMLMTTVGMVLLIACANIANLLLARASARKREISVRMAIGASRARVVRQLMTESLLLSTLGAAGGFVLAQWAGRLLVKLISTSGNPLDIDLPLDSRVLAFVAGVSVLTAVLFGLGPALRVTRAGLAGGLKEDSRGGLRGANRLNPGKALVSAQVALSLVLLVSAGLFVGTWRNLLAVDTGFSRHNVLLVAADIQQAGVPASRRAQTYSEILDRLKALPGVVSAASSMFTPISGAGWAQGIQAEGFAAKSPAESLVFLNRVSPGYFKTMRTPVLMGRDFNERDGMNAQKVMLVGESTARHFFGAANPIGKTVAMDNVRERGAKEVFQVIGVVKDTKYIGVKEQTRRTAFLVSTQDPEPGPGLRYEVHFSGAVEALIPAVRSAITGVNRDILLDFRTLETQVSESLLQPRIIALLASAFGLLALLLAMIGIYGLTAYAVARRQAEIGLRMALGAQPSSVIWLMLRDVLVLLAAGISLGLGISLAAGRLVTTMLYGVRPNEPFQLAGAVMVLAAATTIATYLPARRASRLDPVAALRDE